MNSGSRFRKLLQEFADMSAAKVRIVRKPLIADAAGLDRAARVGGVVSVIRAHVGPEGVRMGDEFGLGKRLQHGVEAFESAVEDRVAGGLRHVSEVDLDGHVQVRGERIHALHFGAVALHLVLDLAQPESSVLHRFRQQGGGFGLRDVGADEPHEAARDVFPPAPSTGRPAARV